MDGFFPIAAAGLFLAGLALGARAKAGTADPATTRSAPVAATPRPSSTGKRTIIVGVGGASGSGKSSICDLVKRRLGNDRVITISFDSYYKPLPHGRDAAVHNFDEPDALDVELLASHLQAIKRGERVEVPDYDFSIHQRVGVSAVVQNPSVVFLDGIFTVACKEIREQCDLTLFAVEDLDTCLIRRLRRDIAERGRTVESVLTQYHRFVKPGFRTFVEPSMMYADLIVPRARDNASAQEVVVRTIMHILNGDDEVGTPFLPPTPTGDVLLRK